MDKKTRNTNLIQEDLMFRESERCIQVTLNGEINTSMSEAFHDIVFPKFRFHQLMTCLLLSS